MNDIEREGLLLDLEKEIEMKDRLILKSMWIFMISILVLSITSMFIVIYTIPGSAFSWIWLIINAIFLFAISAFAVHLEDSAGYYECSKCGHRFKTSTKSAILAQHLGTTRRFKCPKCSDKCWCRKTLTK